MVPVMKKKRYWLIVLLASMLAVVTFLPFILTTASVTQMIVSRINGKIAGNLSIGSWLVGWQQGFLCQDIVYEDLQRGVRITIPRLTSTQGLAELILTPRNFGLVSMDSPIFELFALKTSQDSSPDVSESPLSAGDKTAAWEKLALQLEIRNGLVRTDSSEVSPEIGIKDVDLHSSLSAGEIDFDVKFRALGDQGDFAVKGHLNLPTRKKNLLETLFTEAEVSITNFQFRDYLFFAAQHSLLPTGEGVLTAGFHVKTVGVEDFELSGSADITDLKLAGGFLGNDSPSFHALSFSLEDGEWSKLSRSARQLHLKSDAGTLFCSGEYRDKRMQFNSRGNINIPVLFDQFPHLLKVQEKALIESGALEFTADFNSEGHSGKFDFMTKLENLGGLFNGQQFAWETPMTAILHGENEGLDVKVRRLQVDSPFLRAFGQGDLSSFNLEASADIGQTLTEFGKLFQHPWTGSGEMELLMKAASAGIADNYTVTADLNISHFSLSRLETVVVPNHHFSVAGSAEVPFSLLRSQNGRFDLQFALSSWLGEVFFATNGEQTADGLSGTRYSTDTNLQLDSFSRLLHALDFFPAETKIGGDLQVQAAGYIDKRIIGFDEINSRILDFTFSKGNAGFCDKEVRLYINSSVNDEIPSLIIHDLAVTGSRKMFFSTGAGSNSLDLSGSRLFLHNIGLEAELGKIALDELVIQSWQQPLDRLNARIFIDADLEKLTPLLQNSDVFASDTRLAGTGRLVFTAADKGESGRDIETDLQLAGYTLIRGDKKLLPNDDLKLTVQLEGPVLSDSMAIKDVQLSSGFLDLTAGGAVNRIDRHRELELQGTMTPKMEKFASILGNAFAMDIAMHGGQSQSFTLKYRWPGNGKKQISRTSFSSQVYADTLDYRGLNFSGITMPLSLEDGNLQMEVKGLLNEGLVDLSAYSDFNQDQAIMLVPHGSRIMTGIQLQKPIVEGVLQGIHPLFGVLASPTGQVDVRLDSFAWPIKPQGAYEADFTTVFDVSRVNLDSSGLLRSILTSFALEEDKLSLHDSEIQCSGHEGRITCSPVRILAADSEMVLSGSVGMDKTLDYLLEVPITRKLVSQEVYQFLEGTMVRVPITGTIDKPLFDKNTMTAAIRGLVNNAAVKVVEKQANKLLPELIEDVLGAPQKE